MENLTFRKAKKRDSIKILFFINQLAEYENLKSEVVATDELIKERIFKRKRAEVIFAVADGKEVGFALYFYNYSTFLGKEGLYLEDLFVLPEYRNKGIGKAFFEHLATIAREKDCGRIDWWCLNDNAPALNFYNKLGAKKMSEWTVHRLNKDAIIALAERKTERK